MRLMASEILLTFLRDWSRLGHGTGDPQLSFWVSESPIILFRLSGRFQWTLTAENATIVRRMNAISKDATHLTEPGNTSKSNEAAILMIGVNNSPARELLESLCSRLQSIKKHNDLPLHLHYLNCMNRVISHMGIARSAWLPLKLSE
uniref:Uncharacterized protein n=1 Tax=Schistocephalus solidus TaxID=70667 RepID=A0A0X3P7U0_SCHSO